jgi:hypothetical protein
MHRSKHTQHTLAAVQRFRKWSRNGVSFSLHTKYLTEMNELINFGHKYEHERGPTFNPHALVIVRIVSRLLPSRELLKF